MHKITGPDGTDMTAFVLVDLDGATTADGIVRSAKKILVDGARTMARSRTYAWALLGEQVSGASAGVNVAPGEHAAGMAAFVAAILDRVQAGELALDPGKGVSSDDLAALAEADQRTALLREPRGAGTLADELLATSAVAAASAALGGLDGTRVAVEGAGEALGAVLTTLAAARAVVVAVATPSGAVVEPAGLDVPAIVESWREHGDGFPGALGSPHAPGEVLDTDADALLCGSKLGLIDHEVAERLGHRVIVPVGPVPVTAKGLAVATRRGIVVLPDFLSASGPLHAFRAEGSSTADELLARANQHAATLTVELLEHPEGPLLGACYRAEDFLRTWQDTLPFGRPLA